MTARDIQEVKSRYAEKRESPYAKLVDQMEFPKVKTVVDRLVVDSHSNLWVRTNEEKKDGEKTGLRYLKRYRIIWKDAK